MRTYSYPLLCLPSDALRLSPQRGGGFLLQLLVLVLPQSVQLLLTPRPQLFFSGAEPRVVSSGRAARLQQTGGRLVHRQGQRGVCQQWKRLQKHTGRNNGFIMSVSEVSLFIVD